MQLFVIILCYVLYMNHLSTIINYNPYINISMSSKDKLILDVSCHFIINQNNGSVEWDKTC